MVSPLVSAGLGRARLVLLLCIAHVAAHCQTAVPVPAAVCASSCLDLPSVPAQQAAGAFDLQQSPSCFPSLLIASNNNTVPHASHSIPGGPSPPPCL